MVRCGISICLRNRGEMEGVGCDLQIRPCKLLTVILNLIQNLVFVIILKSRFVTSISNGFSVSNVAVGHFVVGSPAEIPASPVLLDAAPLFEEERDTRLAALVEDRCRPLGLHRTRFRAGFSADDHPMDAAQLEEVERAD